MNHMAVVWYLFIYGYGIRYYGSARSGGEERDPPLEGGACS